MTLLQMTGIRKRFGDAEVLKGVDFSVGQGEIRALVGQNGAGKSSLMKVLAGVYLPDEGVIKIDGRDRSIGSPSEAHAAGVRMVFQEFSLIPHMTAAQNVVLAQESVRFGLTDRRSEERLAGELFQRLGVEIDPGTPVHRLRVGDRQMVEIAKALSRQPRVLVLDEPTAALSHEETERLFTVTRRLRDGGLAIIFISHHMQEVMELCDSVTVLRDGEVAAEMTADEMSVEAMVDAMVPPESTAVATQHEQRASTFDGPPIIEINHLRSGRRIRDISLSVASGEIVGLAGLAGSGTSELLEVLFGLRDVDRGVMNLAGASYDPAGPDAAIRRGVMLLSEDRRTSGITSGHSVAWNMLQPLWRRFVRFGLVDDRSARATVRTMVAKLKVKTTGIDQSIQLLSGGNQQKVLVARSLLVQPRLLLLSEPTAGIDIRARADITEAVRQYVADGGAAIWVSSDLRELAESADRVLVVRKGRVVEEVSETTEAYLAASIQLDAA